jgi:hypothetical protein
MPRTGRTIARTLRTLSGAEPLWPGIRDVSDPWAMAKDGKLRFDPARWPRPMRKKRSPRVI